MGLDEHDGKHIILEDYLNCGIELFSKAGMDFELNRCADELEKRIETMYAVEYMKNYFSELVLIVNFSLNSNKNNTNNNSRSFTCIN